MSELDDISVMREELRAAEERAATMPEQWQRSAASDRALQLRRILARRVLNLILRSP